MPFYSSSAPTAAFSGTFIRNYLQSGACISFHDIRSSCILEAFGTVSVGAAHGKNSARNVPAGLGGAASNRSEVQVSLRLWVNLRPTAFRNSTYLSSLNSVGVRPTTCSVQGFITGYIVTLRPPATTSKAQRPPPTKSHAPPASPPSSSPSTPAWSSPRPHPSPHPNRKPDIVEDSSTSPHSRGYTRYPRRSETIPIRADDTIRHDTTADEKTAPRAMVSYERQEGIAGPSAIRYTLYAERTCRRCRTAIAMGASYSANGAHEVSAEAPTSCPSLHGATKHWTMEPKGTRRGLEARATPTPTYPSTKPSPSSFIHPSSSPSSPTDPVNPLSSIFPTHRSFPAIDPASVIHPRHPTRTRGRLETRRRDEGGRCYPRMLSA
ncbi:hypothetical protein R3P38DRAFT_3469345 [Favolaschia claudopus]|uniref:Uncharacterized protein n=1 Tax=Favolaschia claudopus TaxID=2862362 RepID=A0AAW0CNS4_9AGAR